MNASPSAELLVALQGGGGHRELRGSTSLQPVLCIGALVERLELQQRRLVPRTLGPPAQTRPGPPDFSKANITDPPPVLLFILAVLAETVDLPVLQPGLRNIRGRRPQPREGDQCHQRPSGLLVPSIQGATLERDNEEPSTLVFFKNSSKVVSTS